MFAEGQETTLKKKIIIQGTFKGIRRNRRPKLRWSDGLKKITGHSLNTLPYWRWQMLVVVWSHIMGHNGSAVTWKWRRRLNLGVEQFDIPHFAYLYIKWIKPKYLGYDSRWEGDNLEKIIIQWVVDGTWKQGQQKLKWANGLLDMTVLYEYITTQSPSSKPARMA